MWRGVLNDAALTLSAQKGPDATEADIAEIMAATSAADPVTRTLELGPGATLEIPAGATFTQPIVKGCGTVSGGTLKVSDSLVVKTGETLLASGTVDLTGAKIVISDPDGLESGGSFKFLMPPADKTLTIVGTPEVEGMPIGCKLLISEDGARIVKAGFLILLR